MNTAVKNLDLGPLAYFSHELRTPLNAILGYTDLMARQVHGPIPEEYKAFLEGIQTSGSHLLSMINNILDYSKIQSGTMALHTQSVDIRKLLKTCVKMMEGLATDKKIELELHTQNHLPTLCIDEVLTRQIVLNLVSNAIKFSPKDSKILIAGKVHDDGVTIEISDQGLGMDALDMVEALRPFGQAEGAHKKRHEGTGIGLALVKAVCDMHKAALNFKSVKGEGTSVSVTFPKSSCE